MTHGIKQKGLLFMASLFLMCRKLIRIVREGNWFDILN